MLSRDMILIIPSYAHQVLCLTLYLVMLVVEKFSRPLHNSVLKNIFILLASACVTLCMFCVRFL